MIDDPIIIITGITASGKSELCSKLVEKYKNIDIINCDSKKIYREIPIITAQPKERFSFYKLYGYVSVKENYSIGLWLQDLKVEVSNSLKNLRVPIISGGSIFYINSLINGLSSIPKISKEVKENVRQFRKMLNKEEFYELVLSKDSKIQGKIFMNDSYRLSRALEVVIETGKSIFIWHQENKNIPLFNNFKLYATLPERKYLYKKINSRFIRMINNGAINEIKKLFDMNLDSNLPSMKAHGVQEIIKYLKNEINLDEAINIAQASIRHYAKKQYTWFRNTSLVFKVIDSYEEITSLIE